jgi:hypothetical protein
VNTYYIVIMNRRSREVMVVLRCHNNILPMEVLESYAKWNGVELKDLLYKVVTCADYNDVLEGKDILENLI